MARGHSNVTRLYDAKPLPTNPERFMIPIIGGAQVYSVKELPPLALSKEEWLEIGKRAGWIPERKK